MNVKKAVLSCIFLCECFNSVKFVCLFYFFIRIFLKEILILFSKDGLN